MTPQRFVFIGGLHRSGTSLLFQVLRDHPQISGFRKTGVPRDEGQHLQSVLPTAKVLGGPGRFGFDARARLDENSPLATPASARMLLSEWGRYWDLDAPILLEKSPPNLLRTRFLQALFPSSYFLIILRHPLVVALATLPWCTTPVDELVEHWLVCHEAFDRDRVFLRNVRVVHYEDLVSATASVLAEVALFIGVDRISAARPIHPDLNARYASQWEAAIAEGGSGQGLARRVCRFEHRVRRFGYDLMHLDGSPTDTVAGQREEPRPA